MDSLEEGSVEEGEEGSVDESWSVDEGSVDEEEGRVEVDSAEECLSVEEGEGRVEGRVDDVLGTDGGGLSLVLTP